MYNQPHTFAGAFYFTPQMMDAIFYYMGESDALPVFKRHTPL